MTNGEKLQKTMEEASRSFQTAPEYLKRDSSRPQSASIYRTVQPRGYRQETLTHKRGVWY